MPPVKPLPAILACAAAVFALTGCSLSQRLDKVSGQVEEMYANTKSWEELPVRTITWQQARELMLRHNTDIKKAENAIEDAERESLSIYTDMIPGVSYYGYLTSSIDKLSETVKGQQDFESNININFYLPSLTQVPYRVYASKVQTFAAIKAREGKERELVSQLYQAARLRQINKKQAALTEEPTDEISAMKQANDERQANTRYWSTMARLIGDPNARWEILPQSLPRIRWADYSHKLGKLDPLIVCNFAMQLEQARMSQYSIALRYLPTINTSLYSPSLFSSSGGTYSGTFLNGEDTKLNLSTSYSLDTNLRLWHNYQRSKEQYEIAKRTVAEGMRDHLGKVNTLRRSFAEYETWKSFMKKRIKFTEGMADGNAEQYIERQKNILSMKKELLAQEATSVESEAALILEYGLPGEKPSAVRP